MVSTSWILQKLTAEMAFATRFILGSNTWEKRKRKQDWVEGEVKLIWAPQSFNHPYRKLWILYNPLCWAEWLGFYTLTQQLLYMHHSGKAVPLLRKALWSWGKLWSWWELGRYILPQRKIWGTAVWLCVLDPLLQTLLGDDPLDSGGSSSRRTPEDFMVHIIALDTAASFRTTNNIHLLPLPEDQGELIVPR